MWSKHCLISEKLKTPKVDPDSNANPSVPAGMQHKQKDQYFK